jgi:hypothetical protein
MPCTALLFLSANSSVGNNFRINTTIIKNDAKCDLLYTPMLT